MLDALIDSFKNSWDSYLFFLVLSIAFGFYLVKGFRRKCPQCQSEMKYLRAEDPREGDSNLSKMMTSAFKGATQEDRIRFIYECPQCQTKVIQQGRQIQVIND